MASRASLIQSRSIYVGTLNSVAPSDGNLIVTGGVGIGTTSPSEKLHVDGTIRMSGSTYSAYLGPIAASWGGSTLYPTLYGETAERWVMHINPHISYVQTGVNGYSGSTQGATIRFASNASASSYWDAGVGVNSVGTDTFSIGREGGNFVKIPTSGNLLVGNSNDYTRVSVSNGSSTRTGLTLSDGNTASLMLFAGASAPASISFDTFGLRFVGGSTVGTDNGSEFMRITTSGNVGIGTTSPATKLHIAGGTDASIIRLENTSTGLSQGDTIGAIQFYNNDTTDDSPNVAASIYATAGPSGGSGYLSFRTKEAGTEGAAATATMTLTNGGNVGIGVTTPIQKLEVAGVISAYDRNNGSANGQLWASTTAGATTVVLHSSGNSYLNGGNVGIGTTAPTVPLHIVKDNATINMTNTSAFAVDTGSRLFLGGKYSSATSNNTTPFAWIVGAKENATDGNQAGYLSITTVENGGGFAERMRVTSTGNVGIGTTAPGARLQIGPHMQMDSHSIYGGIIGFNRNINTGAILNNSYGAYQFQNENGEFQFQVYNSSGGNVTIHRFLNNGNVSFAGNVGIGTTSPTAKLHVAGKPRIDSEYSPPPATTATVTDSKYYGFNSVVLTDPDNWLLISIHGTDYVIPAYAL